MITYAFLQNYWWLLISILGALLVFLMFVQGGQSLLVCLPDDAEKSIIVNSLGKKWELTFTTLVVFGGAFFASFPLFYSTSFGGAYWLWMLILFTFVVQAVSYKYRKKDGNIYGSRFYDTLLAVNGFFAPVLIGVAVGTMFFGAEFTVTKTNILNSASSTISQWGPLHVLEAILCWKNLLLGFMLLFLARTLAALYLVNNISDQPMEDKLRKHLLYDAAIFVVLFLAFVAVLFTSKGVSTAAGVASWQDYKYLDNAIEMWWCLAVFVVGTLLVLGGIVPTILRAGYKKGIWLSGLGVVLVVLTLFWLLGYNDTAYYPSLIDVTNSLSIRNSSSSEFTLTVMSIVSLLIPFVLAYIVYAWYSLDKRKITRKEIETTSADEKY